MGNVGRKLFAISLMLFIAGVSGLVWLFSKQESFAFTMQRIDEEQTISQAVNGLDLVTDTADVVITTSKRSSPQLRLIGEVSDRKKERLEFLHEVTPEGTLKVEVREQPHLDWFDPGGRLQVNVVLPEGTYDAISIRSASGDVASEPIQAKRAKIQSSTGDVELAAFTGGQLDVETSTGDMKLSDIRAPLSISSSTGDVKQLMLPELSYPVEIDTDTGDVRISVGKPPAAAIVSLESDTGDVTLNWPALSYEVKEEHRVQGSVGTGGPTLSVRSSTGDIRIQ